MSVISTEHLSRVDVDLLCVLADLLETRNLTRTAARRGTTQSAISRSLARLRALFGDPLLVRDGRTIATSPSCPRRRSIGSAAR